MADIEIIDVVYPSGAIQSVLRLRCNGKVRLFHLSEITDAGIYVEHQQLPPTLKETFEDSGETLERNPA